ncbi:MAG: membrane integrity-associated transporter subunit PqiC [Candidatus Accumulibacter sp.]|uniref:PqiC family protein n=1 Tax=Accumulibacter sp. TaxID=2053492 RepID=UPI001A4FD849|nr:PqiC family protein [Accumulibacter sp.]MBL8393921.1 membrane integrity-associated transporter subunit PqiC [Accumulibacter sp.]
MKPAATIISGLALAVAATLPGCASPSSQFYTLTASATVAEDAAAVSYAVAVDSITLPAAVDRPQWVVRKGPNRIVIDEFNRWAAPLATSIGQTLAENLGRLLGTPRVVSGPLAASFDPAYRVTVDIQRFESLPGEAATLDALWLVRRPTGVAGAISGRTMLYEPVHGAGYDALAAAHSRALARLSGDIATAIRAEASQ